MFRIVLLFLAITFFAAPAAAQNTTCANKPASDNSNACANTRYVTTALTNAYPLMWLKSAQGTGDNATANGFSPINQALWLVGNFTAAGGAPYSLISVNDTGSYTTAADIPKSGLWISHNIGTSAGEGSRAALLSILTIGNPLPCTSGLYCFYSGLFGQAYASANTGGTPGNAKGSLYGLAAIAQLNSGATYLSGVGNEINVSAQAGSSVDYKSILSLISVNADAVAGAVHNAMLVFTADNTTTYKFPKGMTFGRPDSTWPFDTNSSLIDSSTPGTGSRVAKYGIDFSAVAFSSGFLKSTGFLVNGSGATTVASLASTGAVSGTTGNFSSTLSASTITSTGASAGFVAAPRSGSGNSYQWYNPAGTGIKLSDGGSDIVSIDSAGAIVSSSYQKATSFISGGSTPTITGSGACTISTQVGGSTAGRFTATAACAAGQTYTISAMPAAPNGYVCDAGDRTTSGVVFQQTGDSTTTAVFTIRTTGVANNDIIQFKCEGY